ncbi:hypothetical protein [Levilactobacillus sp. HBUAS70063]|uniref:hypothetical protein n=1 Tax=Levilactobacillus sp. HBUAS70063 TaxID=3109359 RepID=UPI0031329D36
MVDRSAHPSAFGWEFQIVTAISLAINNIENTVSINFEGPLEDVEVSLSDGHVIFSQAKSYAKTDIDEANNTGWNVKLTSAITGLFEVYLKQPDNSEFKYLVNYPYPLGKSKGGKTNFRVNEYGEISGTELTSQQVKIIREILQNCQDDDITKLSSEEFDSSFYQFLNHLSIGTYRFTNFKSDRRFSSLDSLIKDFLDANRFSTSVVRLRNHWIKQGETNLTQKDPVTRTEFLFAIALVDNTFSGNELFGQKVNTKQISRVYDRFVDTIEHAISMEDFNRELTADVLDYFELDNIDDYFYSDDEAIKFTEHYLENYLKYFKLNNLPESEQRLLTRFALARCLEERDLMSRLFNKGEIKNAY